MSVSRSKPLDKLSAVRPLNSIFHPSLFLSLLGQFAVHLVVMYLAVGRAKEYLPEDYKVELDGEFKVRTVRQGRSKRILGIVYYSALS
jgi:cation-transporting ATPase 13A1